jgi:hypothetical protein
MVNAATSSFDVFEPADLDVVSADNTPDLTCWTRAIINKNNLALF